MKQRQRRQKIAGIRKAIKYKKKSLKPQPIKVFTPISDAEREVKRHIKYVIEDTKKVQNASRKFFVALLFYAILSISALISSYTDTETKLCIIAGLSCIMLLPTIGWIMSNSSKKRWDKYLKESIEHLETLKN